MLSLPDWAIQVLQVVSTPGSSAFVVLVALAAVPPTPTDDGHLPRAATPCPV